MQDLVNSEFEALVANCIAAQYPGAPIRDIRYIGGGSCNVVYSVCVNELPLVVRMTDRWLRPDEHAKEAWCIGMATAHGISGPNVLATGFLGSTSYMIQEYVVGEQGDSSRIDRLHIWRTLGAYAKIIHSIDASQFPNPDGANTDPEWAEQRWVRYLDYGIKSLVAEDRLINLGVYTSAEQATIRSIFQRLQGQQFTIGLFHGDLSLWNTLVDADGAVTLLDWGGAGVGIVPHSDISSIFRWMPDSDDQFNAFLDGYGISREAFETMLPQVHDYRLLESFDLVRWSIDRRPEELDDYVSRASEIWARYRE